MQIDIMIERAIVLKDTDMTGFSAMLGQKDIEPFLKVGESLKNFYPRSNSQVPIELRMSLSHNAHVYSQTVYKLTDWLIQMGGLSRALYFGGMAVAQIVALRAYKAALIGDIFMI